jgi:hypothetical protein
MSSMGRVLRLLSGRLLLLGVGRMLLGGVEMYWWIGLTVVVMVYDEVLLEF